MPPRWGVVIDVNGWAQAETRPSWRPDEEGHTRWGLPWTPAEDAALLKRCAEARSIGYNDPTMQAAAEAHGRSLCSITTRLCALRAGIRLAEQQKQASLEAFQRFGGDAGQKDKP